MRTLAVDFLESLSFYDEPVLVNKDQSSLTFQQFGLTITNKMCKVTFSFDRSLCDKLQERYPNQWDLFLNFDIDNVKTFEILTEKARK